MGQLVGYQQYRPFAETRHNMENPSEARYFSYYGQSKVTAYGLEQLDYSKPYVFIVEGIFDAVAFHAIGENALAVCSNDPKHLKEWLNLLPLYKIVVCDNDAAGKKLAKYGDTYLTLTHFKDVGEGGPRLARLLARVAKSKIRNQLLKRKF